MQTSSCFELSNNEQITETFYLKSFFKKNPADQFISANCKCSLPTLCIAEAIPNHQRISNEALEKKGVFKEQIHNRLILEVALKQL